MSRTNSQSSRSAAARTERPLGRSQSGLRTVSIGKAGPRSASPCEERLQRLGLIAGDDDELARAACRGGAHDMLDQRDSRDPGERLGRGDGPEPGPLAGGDDQAFHRARLRGHGVGHLAKRREPSYFEASRRPKMRTILSLALLGFAAASARAPPTEAAGETVIPFISSLNAIEWKAASDDSLYLRGRKGRLVFRSDDEPLHPAEERAGDRLPDFRARPARPPRRDPGPGRALPDRKHHPFGRAAEEGPPQGRLTKRKRPPRPGSRRPNSAKARIRSRRPGSR